jgi:cysteine-rich repeat protein
MAPRRALAAGSHPGRLAATAVLAVLAVTAMLAGAARAEPVKCQRAILKASGTFAHARLGSLAGCRERVRKGKLPPATDCAADPKTAAKLAKAESKLRAAVAKQCGGADRTCGTGDDDPLASIGWTGPCPDFEGTGCTNAITHCGDVAECLACVGAAATDQAIRLYYDELAPADPSSQKPLHKCQLAVAKETIKLHRARTLALQRCWDARHRGSHANPCPVPGDGKAADRIAVAASKRTVKICKLCGGPDKVCTTGDDLAPEQIGFVGVCPDVNDCGGFVNTLQDLVACAGCVTAFKVDCATTLAVPALTAYPGDCVPAPAAPACGDGVVQGTEECDDGGTAGGDGCSAACQLEDASALCAGVPAAAGTALASVLVASGLERPLHVTAPPLDPNRVFVVEQRGRIRIVKNGTLLVTPFLAIEGKVSCCGERGLLSVAFHPDYESNGRFFVNYTNVAGHTVIARYQVSGNPDVADAGSELVLLTVAQPFANHNGGLNAFGPDGYLYVGLGDGGSFNDPLEAGQDGGTVLGKLLRLDVDVETPPYHAAPADNPDPGAAHPLDLIWAKGLRNPWRFAFDRATGELYIADVGQNQWEEVNLQPPATGGLNYGWDVFEGRHCFEPEPLYPAGMCPDPPAGFTMPVLEYSHAAGCSVTGGFVYRGCRLPDLHGTYFYGDYCSAFIRTFKGVAGGDAQNLADRTADLDPPGSLSIDAISSFGEDARGELYVTDHDDGEVFKIVPGS